MATKKTIARTKRPVPATRKTAAEQPVDAEIRRAAERAGIPIEAAAQQARERQEDELIIDRVGGAVVLACDQLGEEIAAIAKDAGGGGNGGSDGRLVDALVTLWQLRWDLGLFPGKLDEQQTGGAS